MISFGSFKKPTVIWFKTGDCTGK